MDRCILHPSASVVLYSWGSVIAQLQLCPSFPNLPFLPDNTSGIQDRYFSQRCFGLCRCALFVYLQKLHMRTEQVIYNLQVNCQQHVLSLIIAVFQGDGLFLWKTVSDKHSIEAAGWISQRCDNTISCSASSSKVGLSHTFLTNQHYLNSIEISTETHSLLGKKKWCAVALQVPCSFLDLAVSCPVWLHVLWLFLKLHYCVLRRDH